MKNENLELMIHQEGGFATLWDIRDTYEIENGELCQAGDRTKIYAPMVQKELPSEISKLWNMNEENLLAFAQQYGWLGYRYFKNRQKKTAMGDPLIWVWRHAQTLRLCLELLHALQKNTEKAMLQVFNSCTQIQNGEVSAVVADGPFIRKSSWFLGNHPSVPKNDVRALGKVILERILTKNIQGIHAKLSYADYHDRKPTLPFQFSALIEVPYWQLANEAVGGWLKRCAADGCGAIFLQTDQRQLFCPKGLRQESLCASRDRLRNWREDKKKKKGSNKKVSTGKKK